MKLLFYAILSKIYFYVKRHIYISHTPPVALAGGVPSVSFAGFQVVMRARHSLAVIIPENSGARPSIIMCELPSLPNSPPQRVHLDGL